MNNTIFIIAQIIGFIAFVISLVAYHRDKKEKILGNMLIANVLDLIHYLLLGAYSGCITKLVAMFRNSFIILKSRNKVLSSKIFLYIFILIYILAGIYTYINIWSIFPIVAAIIYMILIWEGDEITLKKTAFSCYLLWLIYNSLVFSISGIVSNIVSMVSILIAIKKEKTKL